MFGIIVPLHPGLATDCCLCCYRDAAAAAADLPMLRYVRIPYVASRD